MKTNEITEINPLFFCRKCNSIPLIELVPKEPEIKILLSCKCSHQQLIKQETFYKYYYNNDYMEIEEKLDIKNEKIKKLINDYEEYRNNFMKNFGKIKDEINKKLNDVINNIGLMIDSNKKFNENIDKIIKMIIKNYELNPNNNNNIENLIKNIQINSYKDFQRLDSIKFDKNISALNKIIESYLKENYIISPDKYQLFHTLNKEDLIIELNKNIFATLKKNESIKIYDLKNNDDFGIKKNLSINKILIDEKKRYFISAEDDYFIKFRDLNEIINKISEKNYFIISE